ncbi:MAG: fimbrial protein [Chania sp.]
MKKLIKGVWLLIVLSGSAWADPCALDGPAAKMAVTIPPLMVQRDLPVGSVIWQQTAEANQPILTGECETANTLRSNLVGQDSGILSGQSQVYSTGLAGVGYAVSRTPMFNDGWPDNYHEGPPPSPMAYFSLRLVVTGPISSGVINSGEYARKTVNGQVVEQLMISSPITITRQACELNDSRDRVVPLPAVLRSSFSGPGSSQGEKTFQLALTCDAGAQVNIQFDGEADASGTPGVLALVDQDQPGVARGIGVQLLYNQTPLKLGERLLLETAPAGLRSYPFTVRYYQTQPQVASGEVNAVATFNLTYQ